MSIVGKISPTGKLVIITDRGRIKTEERGNRKEKEQVSRKVAPVPSSGATGQAKAQR